MDFTNHSCERPVRIGEGAMDFRFCGKKPVTHLAEMELTTEEHGPALGHVFLCADCAELTIRSVRCLEILELPNN